MNRMPVVQPSVTVVAAGALLLSLACAPQRPPAYPVAGQVFYQGKPTPGAVVVFHPVGANETSTPRPSGQVQADGSFGLTTYLPGDGAPEGEYLVAITWFDAKAKLNLQTGEVANRLPARYAS